MLDFVVEFESQHPSALHFADLSHLGIEEFRSAPTLERQSVRTPLRRDQLIGDPAP